MSYPEPILLINEKKNLDVVIFTFDYNNNEIITTGLMIFTKINQFSKRENYSLTFKCYPLVLFS